MTEPQEARGVPVSLQVLYRNAYYAIMEGVEKHLTGGYTVLTKKERIRVAKDFFGHGEAPSITRDGPRFEYDWSGVAPKLGALSGVPLAPYEDQKVRDAEVFSQRARSDHAEAELERARHEVERVRTSFTAALGRAHQEYDEDLGRLRRHLDDLRVIRDVLRGSKDPAHRWAADLMHFDVDEVDETYDADAEGPEDDDE